MEPRMRTYRRVGLTLTYNFAGYKERRHQQVQVNALSSAICLKRKHCL